MKYLLFAWTKGMSEGGFNDLCGEFETPGYAYEFFVNSTHCSIMDSYQIIELPHLTIFQEGERQQ